MDIIRRLCIKNRTLIKESRIKQTRHEYTKQLELGISIARTIQENETGAPSTEGDED